MRLPETPPWSQSKFKEIGRTRLERRYKPYSIAGSLFQRELGNAYFREEDIWLNSHILRQLVSARAPSSPEVINTTPSFTQETKAAQNAPSKTEKWSQMKLSGTNRTMKCNFLFEKIMIGTSTGGRQTAEAGGHMKKRLITPNPFAGNKYHLDYELKLKVKIVKSDDGFDVWYPGPNPIFREGSSVNNIMKVPSTLFILGEQKLSLFDFRTGILLKELSLVFEDTYYLNTKYTSMYIDHGSDKIYITATKASLHKDIFHEVLVLSYPPLSMLYRVIIPKAIARGYSSAENVGDIFVLHKTNTAEIVDFKELLRVNMDQGDQQQGSQNRGYKTIVLTKLSEHVSTSVKTAKNHLYFLPALWPPHVITQTRDSYVLSSLQQPNTPLHSVPNEGLIERRLISYSDLIPNLLYSGLPDGFEILKIDTSNAQSQNVCEKIFPSTEESLSRETINSAPRQGSGRALRTIAKKYYGGLDDSKTYGFDYNPGLDLFALCMVSDTADRLDITLYDNRTMKVYKKLTPIKLQIPNSLKKRTFDSKVEVHFYQWFLAIKVDLTSGTSPSCSDLYIASLMAEIFEN